MQISTSLVQSEHEFRDLGPVWNALAARAVSATTFLTHDWLHSWWCAYRPDARLAIAVARRAGEIVGIAPMMVMRQGGLGRLFRRLRFIGDGTSETDHMNFIVDAANPAPILQALVDEIDLQPWDIAHFNQMPEACGNTAWLLQYATSRGWLVATRPIPSPLRTLPATYDELLKSLPSRLRTAIRSARRALASRYKVDFGLVQHWRELPEALQTLYRNHASRWQAKGEGGVFVSPQKRDFYERLSARLLDSGQLRFFYLKLDDRIVAQQFCFQFGSTVLLLQEGFDYEFARLNVGNALRAMVFEWLIGQGVQTYDFLAGISRHKQSWSNSIPHDVDIRACRPTLMGRAAFNLPRLLRQAQGAKQAGEAELVE